MRRASRVHRPSTLSAVLIATLLPLASAAAQSARSAPPPGSRGFGAGPPSRPPTAGESGSPLRLSLEGAVARAVRENEQVLIARAEEARTAGIVKETRADALPRIDADFGYTRNIQTPVLFFNTADGVQQIALGSDNEYDFSLTVSQTLLDFSLGPARSAARLSRRATAAQVERARTDVAFLTRQRYYDVVLSRRLVEVQEQALEQALSRLEQVRQFYEAGTGSEFDVLTAEVDAENQRPPLIEARNRLELDLNRLKRTLGLSLTRRVVLTDSFPTPEPEMDLDASLARALRNRSDLRGQRVRVQLQERNVEAEANDALPALELVGGFQRRASSDDFFPPQEDFSQTITGGLNFSVPLFDGRERSGRVQQARAERDREQFRLAQLREDIRLEVQQAHQAKDAAREQIDAAESNVARAERALEIAQTRFANGLSTQVELDDAELALTEARTNLAEALHAYAVAKAQLQAARGER